MSQPSFEIFIKAALEKKEADLQKRSLPSKEGNSFWVSFTSNDYLGLAKNKSLIQKSIPSLKKEGMGSTGSRLLSGNHPLNEALEQQLSQILNTESALIFNSGYHMNTGIIPAVMNPGDLILADRYIHASSIDGCKLSGATLKRFHHNDTKHLEKIIEKEKYKYKKILIITESVFSMDGDQAPLKTLIQIKKKHHALLMVDEAHAIGILGKNGYGLCPEHAEDIDIIAGTFGKACGSQGAYIGCSKLLKNWLITTCRSFIYSTALPPVVLSWNRHVLEALPLYEKKRKKAHQNALYLRKMLNEHKIPTKGNTPIIPILVNSTEESIALSTYLKEKGIEALPIRYPTVPKNRAQIRLSITANHSKKDITLLGKEIIKWFHMNGSIITQK